MLERKLSTGLETDAPNSTGFEGGPHPSTRSGQRRTLPHCGRSLPQTISRPRFPRHRNKVDLCQHCSGWYGRPLAPQKRYDRGRAAGDTASWDELSAITLPVRRCLRSPSLSTKSTAVRRGGGPQEPSLARQGALEGGRDTPAPSCHFLGYAKGRTCA